MRLPPTTPLARGFGLLRSVVRNDWLSVSAIASPLRFAPFLTVTKNIAMPKFSPIIHMLEKSAVLSYNFNGCRSGGIGRRGGLKIRRSLTLRVGSTPTLGTKSLIEEGGAYGTWT